jgi:hypothetical protein
MIFYHQQGTPEEKKEKEEKQHLPTKERTRKMISTAVKLDHAQQSLASEGTARNSKTLISSFRIQRKIGAKRPKNLHRGSIRNPETKDYKSP